MKRFLLSTLLILSAIVSMAGGASPHPKPMTIKDTMLVIVYTETTGYNHNTKSQCVDFFGDLADSLSSIDPFTHYVVKEDPDGSFFDLNTLRVDTVKVVVFCNTSGNGGLNQAQRNAFEAYIMAGGDYIGIHAATDTYRHSTANGNKTGTWDWYAEEVAGKSVQESPNHTSSSKVALNTPAYTPYTLGTGVQLSFPPSFSKKEEYYYWENGYESGTFSTVIQVEVTGGNSYDIARDVAWFKALQWGGCSCSTSWGHDRKNFTDTDFGEQGFYFKRLLWSFFAAPCVVNLAIPTPRIIPGPNPVFVLDNVPPAGLRWVQVYDIRGTHIETFEMSPTGEVRKQTTTGLYVYKTAIGSWIDGVKALD